MKSPLATLAGLALLFLTSCSPKATPSPTRSAHSQAHEHEEHGHEEEHPESGKGNAHAGGEGHVALDTTRQQASRLRVEQVQLRDFAGEFQASGTLTFDENLLVRVTSRISGKALELRANLGDSVKKGQLLSVIDAPEVVELKTRYHEAQTDYRLARQALERRRSLAIYGEEIRRPLDEARNEVATAQADLDVALSAGKVTEQKLRRVLQLLDEGITSRAQAEQARAEHEQSRAQLSLARKRVRISLSHLAREERIVRLGLLANREIQEAVADVERAEERTQHLRNGLEALHADPESHGSLIQVTAPIDGIVIERPVTLGESVSADENLYTLADTQRLWLWVSVVESELSKLRRGQEVEVSVSAFPKRIFTGRISYIAPELDSKTRTIRAQVIIENEQRSLRPAMFARVRVVTGAHKGVVVPVSALQRVEDVDVVYVQEEPHEFVRRPVAIGQRTPQAVQILQGLQPGERIVTQNAHILKAEDLKSTLEEGGHSH